MNVYTCIGYSYSSLLNSLMFPGFAKQVVDNKILDFLSYQRIGTSRSDIIHVYCCRRRKRSINLPLLSLIESFSQRFFLLPGCQILNICARNLGRMLKSMFVFFKTVFLVRKQFKCSTSLYIIVLHVTDNNEAISHKTAD